MEEGGSRQKQLECCFLFALFWSTGCTSDAAGRAKYSLFVREVMENVDVIDEKYQGVATALAVRKWVKPTYEDATQSSKVRWSARRRTPATCRTGATTLEEGLG